MSRPAGEPIPVHLTSSDIPLAAGTPKRKRRALKTNTFTLTSGNSTQRVMPQSDTRAEGWITSAIAASSPPVIFIAANQADAASQGGGAAQISGTDTAPFPVNTTDAVWVSAATGFPVTISVVQIYEEDE